MGGPAWIVVTDFDGTLSEKDIGNELCVEILGEKFRQYFADYRKNLIDLKTLQLKLWTDFPLAEKDFRQKALAYGDLKKGATDFLAECTRRGFPIFVASCGLRPYIEEVLKTHLPAEVMANIREIRCNETEFDHRSISKFIPPRSTPASPYPLDKGAWATELRAQYPGAKVLGLGNGTSDRSFLGHVDRLAATESLAEWCLREGQKFVPFETFLDLNPESLFLI